MDVDKHKLCEIFDGHLKVDDLVQTFSGWQQGLCYAFCSSHHCLYTDLLSNTYWIKRPQMEWGTQWRTFPLERAAETWLAVCEIRLILDCIQIWNKYSQQHTQRLKNGITWMRGDLIEGGRWLGKMGGKRTRVREGCRSIGEELIVLASLTGNTAVA